MNTSEEQYRRNFLEKEKKEFFPDEGSFLERMEKKMSLFAEQLKAFEVNLEVPEFDLRTEPSEESTPDSEKMDLEFEKFIQFFRYHQKSDEIIAKAVSQLAGRGYSLFHKSEEANLKMFAEHYSSFRTSNTVAYDERGLDWTGAEVQKVIRRFRSGDVTKFIDSLIETVVWRKKYSSYWQNKEEKENNPRYQREDILRSFLSETLSDIGHVDIQDIDISKEREELWHDIETAQDVETKMKLCEMLLTQGIYFFIGRLSELHLPPEQEDEILFSIAQQDVEGFFAAGSPLIPFHALREKEKFARIFLQKRPDLLLLSLPEWNFSRAECTNLIGALIQSAPEVYLRLSPSVPSHFWSKQEKENFESQALAVLGKLEISPEETLEKLGGIEFDSPLVMEEIAQRKKKVLEELSKKYQEMFDVEIKKMLQEEGTRSGQDDYMLALVQKMKKFLPHGNDAGILVYFLLCNSEPGMEYLRSDSDFALNRVVQADSLTRSEKKLLFDKTLESHGLSDSRLVEWVHILTPAETPEEEDAYFKFFIKAAESNESFVCVLDCLKYCKLSPKKNELLLQKIIDLHALMFFFELVLTDIEEKLTDEQRIQIIDRFSIERPFELASHYYEFHFRDQRKEIQVLKNLIDKKIEPFCYIESASELKTFLSKEQYQFLWKKPIDKVNPLAKIHLVRDYKKRVSKKEWDAFETFFYHDFGWGAQYLESMTQENFLALQILFAEAPEIISQWKNKDGSFESHVKILFCLNSENVRIFIQKWKESAEQINEQFNKDKKRYAYRKESYVTQYGSRIQTKEKPKRGRNEAVNAKKKKELALPIEVALSLICGYEKDFIQKEVLPKIEALLRAHLSYNLFEAKNIKKTVEFIITKGAELKEFVEHNVIGLQDQIILTILKDDSPEERFAFFQKHADKFGTWNSEAARLVSISSEVVFSKKDSTHFFRDDLRFQDENKKWKTLAEASQDELLLSIENALESGFTLSPEQLKKANQRNMEYAELFAEEPLHLWYGTQIHYSRQESSPYILEQGNLCGECIGIESKPDSYPFFVDTIQITPDIAKTDVASLLEMSSLAYGRKSDFIYVYPFRNDTDAFQVGQDIDAQGSWIKNHKLTFVMLPKTELGAIIVRFDKDEPPDIEKLKEDIVKNDLYVPIFDAQGKLLFTPNDFFALQEQQKPYASLRHLLEDTSYLDELDIPQSAALHEFTLREHLLVVQREAERLAHEYNLDEEHFDLVRVAARLHDIAKETVDGPQQFTNVEAAEKILDAVLYLSPTFKRRILVLIRNDELLGEVLQGVHLSETGMTITPDAEKKLQQFHEIFSDQNGKKAMLCLYRADVLGIGNNMYNEWQVDEKLKALGLFDI